MRIFPVIAATLALLPFAARADSAADFERIVKTCEAGKEQALACEKAVWDFTDVAKDGKLTVAELSRLARLFGESMDRKMAAQGKPPLGSGGDGSGTFIQGHVNGELSSVPVALLLGPLTAQLLIANFDYNGDGAISRDELYADLPEGRFTAFVEQITESGKQAFGQAAGSMFSLWAQNTLGMQGQEQGQGARPPSPSAPDWKLAPQQPPGDQAALPSAPSAAPPPATGVELVDWVAAFHDQKPRAYYAIDYTLRNTLDKPVQRVDGTIEFQGPDGIGFMSIQIAQGKAIPAGGDMRLGGNYPVSDKQPDQLKLRNLDKQSIRAVLTVERIVFDDNTVQRF